jgi:hypothetical protein
MGRSNPRAYRIKYRQELMDLGVLKDGAYTWPVPVGESYQIRSRNSAGEQPAINVPKAREFVEWAIRDLKASPKEFYSPSRRQEYIKIRSLIVYAVRTRFKLPSKTCENIFKRDATTISYLQGVAVKTYGTELREVSNLLRRWDEKCEHGVLPVSKR